MAVFLFCLGLIASAVAVQSRQDEMAVMDSLRAVHPRLRAAWLHDRGFPDVTRPSLDSQGLRVVGRWSFGPASDVDGSVTPTETIVALARGSGVSLLRLSRGESLRVNLLSDINSDGLAYQVRIRDSLLLVSTGAGLDLYSVADVRSPIRLSTIGMVCTGFDFRDSLLYALGNNDSFRVYSIAEPAAPRLLGACRDSGGSVSVAGNTAFIAEGGGLYAIDVSNPSSPHRVGSYPGWAISATARGDICCVTFGNPNEPRWLRFSVLDVSDPTNMQQIGYIDSCGGYDVYLDGSLAFISGYYTGGHEFQIVSIADSTHPVRVGDCTTLGYNFGVWANASTGAAFVADDYCGLDAINIVDLGHPRVDSVALRVGFAKDVSIDGNLCYVASEMAGLKVLDISVPSVPCWVGDMDTAYDDLVSWAVAARDSFAYVSWGPGSSPLRSIDVTDPSHPRMAAGCGTTTWPEDMVLRDSFLYVAEDYVFQIVNVARPRAPQVVGTCGLPERSREVILSDTLAYVANFGGVLVLSVARPDNPRVVANWPRLVTGIDMQDTVLYAVTYSNDTDDVLLSLSIANPAAPYVLDSVIVPRTMHDVAVVDTIAYCAGWEMAFVSVADPRNLHRLPDRWVPPSWIRRVIYAPPYIYTCCTDGGVCIHETLETGISEEAKRSVVGQVTVAPTVTTGWVRFLTNDAEPWQGQVTVYDATGAQCAVTSGFNGSRNIDLSSAPGGVYLLRLKTDKGSSIVKVVKTARR